MSVLALISALLLLWLSTLQIKQPWRLVIWTGGFALIVAAVWTLTAQPDHFGLFRALADAWDHRGDLENSVLVQAFSRNAPSVGRFVPQLLDLFAIAAIVIAALALAAFTRGEQLERALRPAIFVLWGFMAGAAVALSVVAIGFGGQIRPRGYFGQLTANDVHDGDTFWIGEMPLRLWGVDAPELTQSCSGFANCGADSRLALVEIVGDGLVHCEQRQRPSGSYVESFGRPLVQCSVRRDGQPAFDLGQAMIERGFAVQYEGDSSFGYSDAERIGEGHGIMSGCSLRPDVWRRDREARRAFLAGAETMGACAAT